jgi:hypothetical protein
VANKTNNYKLPKPEADDFYDISEYNKTMDILDDSLTEMDEKKLDKNGDASEAVTEFEQEILRENIESGETLSTTFGKVKKWFSEMKDVAFSGHAKDVATDAAHRFVSDAEKSSWNGKVGASGGDISDTVIGTLESIDSKYPVPAIGETAKVFMGKVKKYIEDTKPLEKDIMVYVATTGSDSEGDGTIAKPYKTITYTVSRIPKNLGGQGVTILIEDGTYDEEVVFSGFANGVINTKSLSSPIILSKNCKIRKIKLENNSARLEFYGIYLTQTYDSAFSAISCTTVYMDSCQSIETAPESFAFDFIYAKARMTNCKCLNHSICMRAYCSEVTSANWQESSALHYGLMADTGGKISKIGKQPIGSANEDDYTISGGIIINSFGAKIGTLINDTTIYVATTGSDTNGDGTSAKPYKTIQYAVDSIPKDLGGHSVRVIISDGIYDENVIFYGYNSGFWTIESSTPEALNSDCKILSVEVKDCTYVHFKGITFTSSATALTSWNSILRLFYCQSTVSRPGNQMCYAGESICDFMNCKCINSNVIVNSQNSRITSVAWTEDSSAITPFSIRHGSILSEYGNQPLGRVNNISSPIFHQNNTQISDLITTGLSCSWGKITSGGYVRHGNVDGYALVTFGIRIEVTSALSYGVPYYISGFPPASMPVGVCCHAATHFDHSVLGADGKIVLSPSKIISTIPVGNAYHFSATYLTS